LELESDGFSGGGVEELGVRGELREGELPVVNFDTALIKDEVELVLIHF
jgi:hypothetical protein